MARLSVLPCSVVIAKQQLAATLPSYTSGSTEWCKGHTSATVWLTDSLRYYACLIKTFIRMECENSFSYGVCNTSLSAWNGDKQSNGTAYKRKRYENGYFTDSNGCKESLKGPTKLRGDDSGGCVQKEQGHVINCWRFDDKEKTLFIAMSYLFTHLSTFQEVVSQLN
ncbi:uncharacterized protein LOC130369551 isoform X2 [Hyla sarda]|uniref:uncharacterized protein LOC130369551 isoform X2 n=1 Tax=Hyla sarda TaxID=327740 RepID=UPI0024C456C0|nr:uncharacterized protein LOC130369551 isoform X2 [Hyla sarda]